MKGWIRWGQITGSRERKERMKRVDRKRNIEREREIDRKTREYMSNTENMFQ
jgi:hypothetical protein